jgi:alpha/beta superfamily hydrolase
MSKFEAGLDGVTFYSHNCRILGGFYKGAGDTARPTAILLHGLPGIEKHLDIAYRLRDLGWNCLYFHFRGSWGSHGSYSLDGLANDTQAATEWVLKQPSVDKDRVVLIGTSTGSYPAFLYAANEPIIRSIVAISPVIEPNAFQFPKEMANEFAEMLNGVTGADLIKQWENMISLRNAIQTFSPRSILLIASENDPIFPPDQYASQLSVLPNIELIRKQDTDHGFSNCRQWLVQTVTDWLVRKFER